MLSEKTKNKEEKSNDHVTTHVVASLAQSPPHPLTL